MKHDGILSIIIGLQTGNKYGKTYLTHTIYRTKTTYTTKYYIGYHILTKKHMITLSEKAIYHQCVVDVRNTMKHLSIFCTTVEIEKKYGTLLNP